MVRARARREEEREEEEEKEANLTECQDSDRRQFFSSGNPEINTKHITTCIYPVILPSYPYTGMHWEHQNIQTNNGKKIIVV